mmetsp:Transcript_7905/g.19651  ORF Transcript_7905/g.19651 Transcript_7905/m.19651 type:complete len:264 (-) Transcript_7905:18-809(-)
MLIIGGAGSLILYVAVDPAVRHYVNFTTVPFNVSNEVQFLDYDATISFPDDANLIPSIVPVVIPAIWLWVAVGLLEWRNTRAKRATRKEAAWTTLFVILDWLQGFVFVVLIQQATTLASGKLRPDFFARCNPDFTTGMCTNPDDKDVNDARKSFFSGHTSTGHFTAAYYMVYIIWNSYLRFRPDRLKSARNGCCGRWSNDIVQLISLLTMLGLWVIVWIISISRVIDNHHAAEDITAGVLVSTIFATMFAVRALARHRYIVPQ